ncbi:protein zwilch homolog isoform 1-T3 [Amazona ochrocephala]
MVRDIPLVSWGQLSWLCHSHIELQNHGMVWVGRDLKVHPVPAHCYRQGHLQLEQVSPSWPWDTARDGTGQGFKEEAGWILCVRKQKWNGGVSSYQELIACFTLVLESLECGEIQPWIHHGSGSLLSKLIQQSYHGKMEAVSLTGITSVQMLLENGLDKMKKDYVSFFIGQELATLTSLDCFISTSVDLQEQVHCVQKLHHMLEIMVSCTVLLQFKHESLFPWTQICIKY